MKGVRSRSILILIGLLVNTNCRHDDTIQREKFVGQWTITQAAMDGVLRPEWLGKVLLIKQTGITGGTYEMPATVHDSIWHAAGTWTKSDYPDKLFYLDDSLTPLYYSCPENELYISRHLNVNEPPCTVFPCVLDVHGEWMFKFIKNY